MRSSHFEKCTQLSVTYGDVIGLFFGLQPAVLVTGWDAVSEALSNNALNARPSFITNIDRYGDDIGMSTI